MPVQALSEKTAIAGLGWTAFTRNSGTSAAVLVARASLMAIEDAGLQVEDIDGVVGFFWRGNPTITSRALARMLGIPALNFDYFHEGGGWWNAATVLSAATLVHSGLCRNVLVYTGCNGYSEGRAARGSSGGARGPAQFTAPFGSFHAAVTFGQVATAQMEQYGIDTLDFAHLAVTQRQHASLNTKAQMRTPITIEDHQNSRWIIYPYRLLDCCQETDGAVALVVTSAEQARDLRHNPVYIMGGSCGEPEDSGTATRLFEGAGIAAADVDIAESYDDFTFMCLKHLADFQFAPRGEVGAWIREGHAGLDGGLPVNTHGGLLSEAHLLGLNHVIEAVQQLRVGGVVDDLCDGPHTYDRATCRQVRDPEIAFVCGVHGGSAVLLRKG
jgi:acetyl-CoA acetyltransferase